jgi:hypothetical protein
MHTAVPAPAPAPEMTTSKASWSRDAVIYQVYVRSFADSDGDGVGDLPGITSRLDDLVGLDVDAVWLTPFYRSPMADGGYDVADYRGWVRRPPGSCPTTTWSGTPLGSPSAWAASPGEPTPRTG